MSNASDVSEFLAHAFSLVFVEGTLFPVQHQSFAGKLDEVALSPEIVVKALSELEFCCWFTPSRIEGLF